MTVLKRNWHRQARYLPICAILVAISYVVLLPFFFLFGWVVPTIVNLLLSAWMARFVASALWVRALCFLIFSLVLGINTSFLKLATRITHTPSATVEIRRSVPIKDKITEVVVKVPFYEVIGDPLSSPVTVGGDEGCGCMYFLPNDPAVSLWVENIIGMYIHKMPKPNPQVHFRLQLAPDEQLPSTANFRLEIYDGTEETASFEQDGIPYDPDIEGRTGRDRGLLNGHYLANSISMLLHNNVWTYLLRGYVAYIPRNALQDFLVKAMPKT